MDTHKFPIAIINPHIKYMIIETKISDNKIFGPYVANSTYSVIGTTTIDIILTVANIAALMFIIFSKIKLRQDRADTFGTCNRYAKVMCLLHSHSQ